MPNSFGAPEVTVKAVAQKIEAGDAFIWLDVREPNELTLAAIGDARVVNLPLSQLAARGADALSAALRNQKAEIVVFCHHGMRSAQVTAWLRQQGWQQVVNMTGGIDAWAVEVDPAVSRY
jgi:rhodanese-related sulfurtransferase